MIRREEEKVEGVGWKEEAGRKKGGRCRVEEVERF
jgi:hypothetical protein